MPAGENCRNFRLPSECATSYALANALYRSQVRGSAMRTEDRSPSLPGWRMVQDGDTRIRRWRSAAPLIVKILLVVALIFLSPAVLSIALVGGLIYAPFAVSAGHRGLVASLSVAVWGLALVSGLSGGANSSWFGLLLLLPFAVVALAHAGPLGRWFVPCRTVAWTLGWALPIGIIIRRLAQGRRLARGEAFAGLAVACLIAFVVLGWRLAKASQEEREFGRQQARGGALAAPYGWPPAGDRGATGTLTRPRPGTGGATGRGGGRAGAAEAARLQHGGESQQPQAGGDGHDRSAAAPPDITVDEAMAELDNMIGLNAVKEQIRSIAASIEAARRRAVAGYSTDKPMQHMVFLGPPGTGKTAVARIVAKIFYAFGLLDTPSVVEAHRADLVGEYLGATAIKTNELVDSALGGVLFIDEAYGLVNEGDGQTDRFGSEAVQALLTRAEDDRENLIIILA